MSEKKQAFFPKLLGHRLSYANWQTVLTPEGVRSGTSQLPDRVAGWVGLLVVLSIVCLNAYFVARYLL